MRISIITALLVAGCAVPALAHGDHGAQAPSSTPETPAPDAAAAPIPTPPGAVPADQLAVAPEGAERYVILSTAGPHGTAQRWRDADGATIYRESILLRGIRMEQDARVTNAPSGLPLDISIRGFSMSGNAAEHFAVTDGMARWTSPVDAGEHVAEIRAAYVPQGGPGLMIADLAERLMAEPGHRMALYPSGQAWLEPLTTLRVGEGAHAREVQAWSVNGLLLAPFAVWMDGDRFFASLSWLAWMPESYVGDMARMQAAQDEALARRNPAFVEQFGQVPTTPVAFEHVRLFDSIEGAWRDDQTVVVRGRYIMAAGPSARTVVPAGARRIDGRGKTLLPGLWDAHMHFADDATGPMLLSMGVTSARDPGADIEPALARLNRISTGQLLAPTIYTSVLIDGAGPLAAQGGVTVSSTEEAVAAVDRAYEQGFRAIKFYTSMQPDWLRAGVAEARRLGMHVHGHVPATMRPMDAIDAGYSEITHVNFIAMQAMPDSVVNISNTLARVEGPARYARDMDVTAPPITTLLARMAAQSIVSDPTLVVFESLLTVDPGTVSPAYQPFIGTLPALMERSLRSGGLPPAEGLTRDDYRASFARLQELVGQMQASGVPIVAGTDGGGLELIRELELYVAAGLTPAQAIQAATIRPARLVGADRATGSITPGKEADLVLVDGDPSQDIGALRRTLWVISDGKLIDANALREAVGFSGAPR